jgi:hypothetical protein
MPPIIRQQTQPACMHVIMHSQVAWHMSEQALSPLVHVTETPIFVSLHSHLQRNMLHWQTVMPFIMHEQLHMLPAIILQRFCSVAADISSSQVQVIFMPPWHFSIFMVARGTIIMPGIAGAADGIPPAGIEPIGPMEPIIERSNIIVLDIFILL